MTMRVQTDLSQDQWQSRCKSLGIDPRALVDLEISFNFVPAADQGLKDLEKPHLLALKNRAWQLISESQQLHATIDFDQDVAYRRVAPQADPLLKAIGKLSATVWDGSLGFARDAVFLAQRGFSVQGFERNPLMYLLLKEAHARTASDWAVRLEIGFGNITDQLKQPVGDIVIYFDPLFELARSKSKSRKEMEILKEFGADEDLQKVFDQLLAARPRRLVVKRADKAPTLGRAIHSVVGKTVRFDIY